MERRRRGAVSRASTMTLQELYEEHRSLVYGLCLRFSGGRPDWAEDVAHDVFVRLFERIDQIDESGNVSGLIYRITVNACLSYCRREGRIWRKVFRQLKHHAELGRRPTDPHTAMTRRRSIEVLEATLGKLQPLERSVFCMKHLDELPQTEIAQQLAISNGYVSKLLARAEEKIQKELRSLDPVAF